MKYSNIIQQFIVDQDIMSFNQFGEGHIHETFLLETRTHQPDYILQKINQNVFRNIPAMMQNIEAVSQHLRVKINGMPGHDPDRETLILIHTKTGRSYYQDDQGCCWRVFKFIPDTVTHQQLLNPALAFEAGKAIGSFQAMLADLEKPLQVTIPDFHNIRFRIKQYFEAMTSDQAGRVSLVKMDSGFAESRFDRMIAFFNELNQHAVVRATHNDTKLNNILFNSNNKALCLIDLDTVMPGYVHFDYGDALRTMSNTALEDEKKLSKVMFNKQAYNSFTAGYLQEADGFLAPAERELLPFAPIYLTFIIGLRFLTDYINDDVYFRVHYPEHNLVRARVQFKLVSEMEKSIEHRA